MHLKKTTRPKALISLVPMIDVLLIMLVFFMVTSTYLDLDMVPLAEPAEETGSPQQAAEVQQTPMLVRLAADGRAYVRGEVIVLGAFGERLRSLADGRANPEIILLPSPQATTQSLVALLDAATQANLTRVRVVRLEARP